MADIAGPDDDLVPGSGARDADPAMLGYGPAVWFAILGHLAVRRADGSDVPVPGPARRQVLAALLSRPGALVTTATLIEDLWGSAPPRSATASLRSHIMRLRAALARGGQADVLVTVGDAYRLDIAPGDVDAGRFEALVQEARRTSDPVEAIKRYDQGLALWRGEPYIEFGDAPFAVLERIRLTELRALARELRADLVLAVGTPGELVGDLEQRVRAEPYRERGWEQLALALYRAGRQADALSACRRARQVLLDDLGVDPGPGLRALEQRLLEQDPSLLVTPFPSVAAPPAPDRCPYLGLAHYDEQSADLFVGRERVTSALAGRLADESLIVVTGASGVGKSSLVRAGLVPALRGGALPGSSAWRIEVRTPGPTVLADDKRRPDLLVLDQAEELFIAMDPAVRDDLVSRLASFVGDEGGRLVIVLRSDFYGRLADLVPLAPYAERAALLVGPMRADELRRALVEPARRAGFGLEDELVETIMDDAAGQPEPLPLLSEAMVRTWERRDGRMLTLAGYERAGELAGALEAAAEDCYARLNARQQRAARRLLVRLALRTETGWVRRPITVPAAPDETERAALSALVAARLVVADGRRVELSHEALLVHWPRLHGWLGERSLAAEMLQHLDRTATDWDTAGRRDADLYRGPRLSGALGWRDEHPEDLSPLEQDFLDASARAAEAELHVAQTSTRRLRAVAVVLGIVTVLAAAGGLVAVHERNSADAQRALAQQTALTSDARRLAALSATAPDIATSSLLAVAAYRLQDSADTRGALLDAVERNQSALWRRQFPRRPQRVFATPDGSRVAVNDNSYHVMLIDPTTRRQVGPSIPTIGFLDGITADARSVVADGPTNTREPHWDVTAYDVSTGRPHLLTADSGQDVWYSTMTSDGRWVAVITTQHLGRGAEVEVWDSRDWAAPPRRFATSATPAALAAGRSVVAVEHTDASVEVRALPSLRVVAELPATHGTTSPGTPLAVSSDGSELARVDPSDPRRASLYRLGAGGWRGVALPTAPQPVSVLSFAPGDSELAVGSESGSLAVFAQDGSERASYPGHAGPLHGLTWAGTRGPTALYSVGLDGQLVSWDLRAGPRTVTMSGPDRPTPLSFGGQYGSVFIDASQAPGTLNSTRRIFALDERTQHYLSWPAGLIDAHGRSEAMLQLAASTNDTYATADIQTVNGAPAPADRVAIYDLRTGRTVGRLRLPRGNDVADGYFTAVSPDGTRAYCDCSPTPNEIDVFALPSGTYLTSFRVPFAGPDPGAVEAQCWRFDPSGRLVVVGHDPAGSHERLALVDVSTHAVTAQSDLGSVDPPTTVAWSRDGHAMVLGGDDGSARLYDARTLHRGAVAPLQVAGAVVSVSFAPDDRTVLISGTDGTVRLANVPDLSPVGAPLPVGSGSVWAWYDRSGDIAGLAPDPRSDTGRYRQFTMIAGPRGLAGIACELVGADITRGQWRTYVGDRPYQHVCPR